MSKLMDWFLYDRNLCHEQVEFEIKQHINPFHATPQVSLYTPRKHHKTIIFENQKTSIDDVLMPLLLTLNTFRITIHHINLLMLLFLTLSRSLKHLIMFMMTCISTKQQ